MALWQQYTFIDIATLLAELATFGAANGWTVTTSTSSLVVMSKGGVTFSSALSGSLVSHTATVGGLESPAITTGRFSVGKGYVFISCGNNIFFGYQFYNPSSQYVGWFFAGLMTVTAKVGNWSGGTLLQGTNTLDYTYGDLFLNHQMSTRSTLLYDGAWVTAGATAAGRLYGSIGSEGIVKNPNFFNAATIPAPVMLYVYDTNTAYIRPIGYAPDVFRAAAGTIYANGDILTIGGDQYLFLIERNLLFRIS